MSFANVKDQLAIVESQITGIASRAISGTAQKTASSATIAGTGTAFTAELKIGQVISIPGTATERFVISNIASDTSLTVTANAANNASGQTLTSYSVFAARPNQPPLDADCPCVINDYDPANLLGFGVVAHQLVQFKWKFTIKFLLHAIAQGALVEWDDAIEPYPKRFIDALFGALGLNAAAVDQDLAGNIRPGIVDYRGSFYFGLEIPWYVNEDIATTIAA